MDTIKINHKINVILEKVEFNKKDVKEGESVELISGIDSSNSVLKEEDMRYLYRIEIKKDTPLFDIKIGFDILFEKGEKEISEKELEDRAKEIAGIEGNLILSFLLKYCGIPPYPLLVEFKESSEKNAEISDKIEEKSEKDR